MNHKKCIKKYNNKKNLLQRLVFFSLFLVITLTTAIIQPIAQIIFAEPVDDSTSIGKSYSPEDSLKSKIYFYSIESCLTSLSDTAEKSYGYEDLIKQTYHDISYWENLAWFPKWMGDDGKVFSDSSNRVAVSYLEFSLSGEVADGIVYCDAKSGLNYLLKDAFELWGLSNDKIKQNLICSEDGAYSGLFEPAVPTDGVRCDQYSGTEFKIDALGDAADKPDSLKGIKSTELFKQFIVDNVYGGDESYLSGAVLADNMTAVETYVLNYSIVNTFCGDISDLYGEGAIAVSVVDDDEASDSNGEIIEKYVYKDDSVFWADAQKIMLWQYSNTSHKNQAIYGYPIARKTYTSNDDDQQYVYTTCSEMVGSLSTHAAEYAEYYQAHKDVAALDAGTYDNGGDGDTTTCAINTIGWIICPVVNFMSDIVDASWGVLVNFLQTSPSIVSTEKEDGSINPTYSVWQVVRNIANVAFVIVFLIIIFSQITSFGISNYGIKKMLPKLIIAAILVNLSYYICQIAVDVSNILGYSIKSIFDEFASGISASSPGFSDWQTGDGKAGGIAIKVLSLVAGYAAWASIGLLIPVLLGGIVALTMILFMLIGRQALIVLLVIMSPLAFVAYLLPNTEKLFDKWKKLSISLLMLFPIVALVMGASTLASTILTEVFTHSSTNGGFNETLGQIAAAAVAILPLFVVPGMLKKSLDGAGNIGGMLNKLSDRAGKGAGNKWTGSKLNKHIEAERANKSARIQGGVYEGGKYGKYNPNAWRSKLHAGINQHTGKYGAKMSAMGVSQADKFNDENVGLATSRLNSLGLDRARIESIALGDDKEFGNNLAMRQAAIKDMVATNNVGGINKLWDKTWDKTIGMDDSQNSKYIRNTFANSLMSSSSRPAYLGGGAVGAMRIHDTSGKGQRQYSDTIKAAINNNTYSSAKIANADPEELGEIYNTLYENPEYLEGGTKHAEAATLIANAQRAIDQPEYYNLNKNMNITSKIVSDAKKLNSDPRQITIDELPKNNLQNNNDPRQTTIDELPKNN